MLFFKMREKLTEADAKRIREIRESEGCNGAEISRLTGMSYCNVSKALREEVKDKKRKYSFGLNEMSQIIIRKLDEKKLTKRDLAERIGYNSSYVGGICNGSTKASNNALEKIAEALDIDLTPYITEKLS